MHVQKRTLVLAHPLPAAVFHGEVEAVRSLKSYAI